MKKCKFKIGDIVTAKESVKPAYCDVKLIYGREYEVNKIEESANSQAGEPFEDGYGYLISVKGIRYGFWENRFTASIRKVAEEVLNEEEKS